MLVTALTSLIGYVKSAEIAKKSHAENRTVLDVAEELTDIKEAVLIEMLEPRAIVGDAKISTLRTNLKIAVVASMINIRFINYQRL
jgi:fumarate hydratase class II